jgi:predicted lipase
VENAGDYAVERDGDTLYIYFECSNETTDWKNNFDFPAKPYKRMGKIAWFAHRGFLRVWKTIERHLDEYIKDESVKRIVIVGYSHGAALAVLCHEYAWYNRPDLQNYIEGYGFGCPRVFWGIKTKSLKKRWERFVVVRNVDDIVTHVPPRLFGFSHVGTIIKIGKKGRYSSVDAHKPESITYELKQLKI